MFEEPTTCNLLATLAFPPWTQSLHRREHMTVYFEKQIPFYAYAQRDDPSATTHSPFPFGDLPPELQLCILKQCTRGTLFHLMHVSSALRVEAAKLFYNAPNVYFHVDGNMPSGTIYDLRCLAHVKRLEVTCDGRVEHTIIGGADQTLGPGEDAVHNFWANWKRICPNVKEVLLNYNKVRNGGQSPSMPPFLRSILQACPSGIDASVLMLDPTTNPQIPWQRMLYKLSRDGTWETSLPRHRTTIAMPLRPGKFTKTNPFSVEVIERHADERCGLWPLMVEAIDRHHFDYGRYDPFHCPLPDCDHFSDKPGAWTFHVAAYHPEGSPDPFFGFLPDDKKPEFSKRNFQLSRKYRK